MTNPSRRPAPASGPLCALAVVLLTGAAACRSPSGEPPAPTDEEWMRRGAATLQPFKERLMAALREGLERGPAEAIQVCRVQAPGLAAAAGGSGIEVGRTSHRLRNPANAPRAWVEPILAGYAAAGGGRAPRVVRLADGGVGYAEPIFVQPICLPCHGESPSPEVRARLRELYPEDRAVGFKGGDLRGLFWVEFAPAASR
jgi:hypothetical protein